MRVLFFLSLLLNSFVPIVAVAQGSIHGHMEGEAVDKHDAPAVVSTSKEVLHIDPSYVQALGVKTAEVLYHDLGRNIRSFGKIVPSTRLEYVVDVRTKGWIVDLSVDALGDVVKEGDLLFTYYSPDLMNAQADFLMGFQAGNGRQRLRLHGMDEKSINELEARGQFFEKTPFYAPADGTLAFLNVRKGAYLQEGGRVMTIQNFSWLWVNVDVPTRDVQFLSVGMPVKVRVPETGDEYQTTIDFIHPVNNSQSRTAIVRLVLNNTKGQLKPETYVDAIFDADRQSLLAVPQEAVLYGSQMKAYVIESLGEGYFRPLMVKTGITSNGLTEIKTGLSAGQHIVISGQFLLDAESNLKSGMAAMGHGHNKEQSRVMQNNGKHVDE